MDIIVDSCKLSIYINNQMTPLMYLINNAKSCMFLRQITQYHVKFIIKTRYFDYACNFKNKTRHNRRLYKSMA